jgi:scaffold protein (connect acetoacetyl-CoA thiolase and HMG-CoA synthase)
MEQQLYFKDYNEALKQNKLLGLKCRACGAIAVPPKMACRQCGSPEMDVIEVKTDGKIKTFTTVFVGAEGRENEVPYILVIVELDEGPWVMGNLEGVDPKTATMELIGKKVKMGNKIFTGDKYSAGESARPVFTLAG